MLQLDLCPGSVSHVLNFLQNFKAACMKQKTFSKYISAPNANDAYSWARHSQRGATRPWHCWSHWLWGRQPCWAAHWCLTKTLCFFNKNTQFFYTWNTDACRCQWNMLLCNTKMNYSYSFLCLVVSAKEQPPCTAGCGRASKSVSATSWRLCKGRDRRESWNTRYK